MKDLEKRNAAPTPVLPENAKVPDHVTLPDHVQRVKDDWDRKKGGSNIVVVSVPNNGAVMFTRLEAEANKVSVWTTDAEEQDSPEFVIVNPPTSYRNSRNEDVEDPMTALAVAIAGVRK